MTTLTGTRAATTFPAQGAGLTAALVACWGHYAPTANPTANDVYQLCRTPDAGGGFLVLGGWFATSDMDTGTETLELDLGWAANGTESQASMTMPWGTTFTDSGYAASAAGFVDSGVMSGDGVTDVLAAGKNYRPILLAAPLWFAKPTLVQVKATAVSATFAAGDMTACLIGQIL